MTGRSFFEDEAAIISEIVNNVIVRVENNKITILIFSAPTSDFA